MQIPENIIKLAIEGGYDKGVAGVNGQTREQYLVGYSQHLVLEPAFWQALGKAKGWNHKCTDCYIGEPHEWCKSGSHLEKDKYENCAWFDCANKFFNLLMTNGDTSKFWDDITSLNKKI